MERRKEIDFIKSIAMLIIVGGHGGINIIYGIGPLQKGVPILYGIGPVHVMLFFVCSGFLLKQLNFREQLYKNIQRLYLPFVGFALVFFIFQKAVSIVQGRSISSEYSYLILEHIFLMDVTEPLLGPMWFITALFLATIMWMFARILDEKICSAEKNNDIHVPLRTIFCIIAALIGINFTVSASHKLAFSYGNPQIINVSLVATVFLELGYLFKKYYIKQCGLLYHISGIAAYACSLAVLHGKLGKAMMQGGINVRENMYGNLFTYILLLLLNWHFLFVLGTWLTKINLLSKIFLQISKNTFWIMALHMLSFQIFEFLFGNTITGIAGCAKIIWAMGLPILIHKIYCFIVSFIHTKFQNFSIE